MIGQGDLVLCTVERIDNTIVFVKLLVDGKEYDGSIVTSEIAPGRIRNLRDYVVPKKKVVCKILRVSERGNYELSLRRVTPKERKEVMDMEGQERAYISILKKILGDKTSETIEKIQKGESLSDFFESAKENPKKLEKLVGKTESDKILTILNTQKKKNMVVKEEISLKSDSSDGVEKIKKILSDFKEAEVRYIAGGKYSVKTESEDIKKADNKLREVLSVIEKRAKENRVDFSIIQK
ncbi:MAG: hypothetical protein AABX93_00360 [Nanoarchaeota archaeon]